MNTRKSDLKATLMNSYIKNIDYIITKNKRGSPEVNRKLFYLHLNVLNLWQCKVKLKKQYKLENIIMN